MYYGYITIKFFIKGLKRMCDIPYNMSRTQYDWPDMEKPIVSGATNVSAATNVSGASSVLPTAQPIQTQATQATHASQQQEENQIIAPQENDLATLTYSIIEWRRLKVENDAVRDAVRERTKKMKALEEIILRVMKSHNIGALDLKNSGGRVLFNKQKRQVGLSQKTMAKLVSEHLQSDEAALELMKYIQEHREIKIVESIRYENS
jgi:hypothetical protein